MFLIDFTMHQSGHKLNPFTLYEALVFQPQDAWVVSIEMFKILFLDSLYF